MDVVAGRAAVVSAVAVIAMRRAVISMRWFTGKPFRDHPFNAATALVVRRRVAAKAKAPDLRIVISDIGQTIPSRALVAQQELVRAPAAVAY